MKSYYERRITYNPDTQNYHITVPELGLEVQSDTEVSGLVEMREEVARASRGALQPVDDTLTIDFGDGAHTITLPGVGWGDVSIPTGTAYANDPLKEYMDWLEQASGAITRAASPWPKAYKLEP